MNLLRLNKPVLGILFLIACFEGNSQDNIIINKTEDAFIELNADTDNNVAGEQDNSYIKWSEDGNLVNAIMGLTGADNISPDGTNYAGVLNNSMVLGVYNNSGFGHLQFGTFGNVRMTIRENGYIGIGNTNPQAYLHISGNNQQIKLTDTDVGGKQWTIGTAGNTNLTFNYQEGLSDEKLGVFQIASNGKVGIGSTATPQYGMLHIFGDGENEGVAIHNGAVSGSTYRMYIHNKIGYLTRAGDEKKGIAITDNGLVAVGMESPSSEAKFSVLTSGGENHIAHFWGSDNRRFTLNSTDNNHYSLYVYNQTLGTVDNLYLGHSDASNSISILGESGQVGIGTDYIPTGYKLAVNGSVIAERVSVDNFSSWPDYVFSNEYELKPLEEVESFVKENNHLPEVPSAKEVEENGVDLGEMDAVLLKKIEELTLYIIEQQKEIKKQQKEIELLKIHINQ